MSPKVSTLFVAAILLAVICLMMCAFQVRFTETAVVTRFDQIKEVIPAEQAGLHFKLPWPFEAVHRYDTRLRSFETEFRQIGTEDQKTVVLTAYATWRIRDGKQFLKAVGREDTAGVKIRDMLENRVSIVLRGHPLSHLVNVNPDEMKFAQIEKEFLEGIKQPARDNYGIEVVSVGIKRLGIPESVTGEVFNRMKEDRTKTIKELSAEGDAKAREVRVTAEEISNKILARAAAYAKSIEGKGEAEAAKYYKEFDKNRALSDFLKKRETLLKVLAGQTTLVLDADVIELFKLLRDATKAVRGVVGSNQVGAADADEPDRAAMNHPAGDRTPIEKPRHRP
ncbi:Modulator of FtsH protease HflC [Phycisphaerae bacterium RAS2]|nr:Modulator of FtsH protease HflC [Phycisphaerae bacterium RAS2]